MAKIKGGTIEIKSGDEAIEAFNAMIERFESGESQLVDWGFSVDEDFDPIGNIEIAYEILIQEWKARGKKEDDPLGSAAYSLSEVLGLEWTEDEPS